MGPPSNAKAEKGGDRDQNEQGSSCLESVPGTFVRRSLMAESLARPDIDAMAGRPSYKSAHTIEFPFLGRHDPGSPPLDY
jgi:hypothetical protein